MTLMTRKALLYQTLPVIEPKRSNPRNQLNKKELSRQDQYGDHGSPGRSIQNKLTAISTVGGN
jgi:hypothetical protein